MCSELIKELEAALEELSIYRAAFERATAGGTTISVEKWGGWRSKYIGPVEFRESVLSSVKSDPNRKSVVGLV